MKALLGSCVFGLSLAFVAVASQPGPQGNGRAAMQYTYLVVYRPGPAWLPGKPLSEQPLQEHGKYMLSLYVNETMKQAGPFTDNAGGAVVLQAADEAEAKAIVANDPAVRSGVFLHEMHPWAPVDWQKYVKK
jgi:uncharacterized protein YciI